MVNMNTANNHIDSTHMQLSLLVHSTFEDDLERILRSLNDIQSCVLFLKSILTRSAATVCHGRRQRSSG